MRRRYVLLVRAVRRMLGAVGLLGVLDRWAGSSTTGRWLRSLLAIYDVQDLVALDTPWWTFRSAGLVADHLARHPGAEVFEWGSGASTAWLSARAGRVHAVEHDADWASQVLPLVGANVGIEVVPPAPWPGPGGTGSRKSGFEGLDFTDYVAAIDDHETFDLIVIDGRAREACLERALAHLADDGLVVFDNVDRERYRHAIAAHPDLDVTWTRGLTPSLPYPTRTALIRRSGRA